jgi:hypothetical protein
MIDNLIEQELRAFIARYIGSISQAEALLVVRETFPQTWTASQIADRLYVCEETAEDLLQLLYLGGFTILAPDGSYLYGCDSSNKRKLVDRFAEAYRRFLIPVTNLIHEKRFTTCITDSRQKNGQSP